MALDLGELVGYLKLDSSGFDSVLDKLPGKLGGSGKKMALAGAAVGGLVAVALGKGLNDAIDFAGTNKVVAAQLGLTAVESARVGTLAGQVYADNYGESVEQVQQTIGGVVTQIKGMGTASDDVVNKMTANVLSYASAYGVDTAEAIAQVQQLMASGLAPTAQAAMDMMTTAMQTVPEALRGDMSDAITEYGPLLAGMGFSGEEAFDLLAKGAEKGMYGIDKAGDAVKEFGIRSTDMSKASKVGYDLIGMSQEEMTGKLLAGGDTAKGAFDDIVKGLNGIEDPAAQSQAALALFGTPLEDLGVTEIPNFLGSLTTLGDGFGDTSGKADELNEKMSSGVGAGMEHVQRQLEILVAGFMAQLLPALTVVFDFLAANPAVITGLAIALGILAVAFTVVTVSMWALSLTPVMITVGLIVIAIGLLIAIVVMLVKNWDEVWAAITAGTAAFVGWFMGVLDVFLGWWNRLWTSVYEFIVKTWDGFIGFIVDTWNGFIGWLMDGLNAFLGWWNGLWSSVGTFIKDAWNSMISFVVAVFVAYISTLFSIGSGLLSWWNGLWSSVGAFLRSVWNGIVSFLSGAVNGLVSFFRSGFGGVATFLSGVWSGIASTISDTWNGVMGFLGALPARILGVFAGAINWLSDIGKNIMDGLFNGIKAAAGRIFDFIGSIASSIGDTFAKVLGIHSPSRVFYAFGKNTVQGYLNALDDMQPALDTRVGDLVQTPEMSLVGAGAPSRAQQYDQRSTTVKYYAAENQSLDAEEALFAALGSPRVKGN